MRLHTFANLCNEVLGLLTSLDEQDYFAMPGARSHRSRRSNRSQPVQPGAKKTKGELGGRPSSLKVGPEVRIPLPPAESPSLSRTHFRRSTTPAFRAGVRGWVGDRVGRDAQGVPNIAPTGGNISVGPDSQYRGAAGGVGESATPVPTTSGLLQPQSYYRSLNSDRAQAKPSTVR